LIAGIERGAAEDRRPALQHKAIGFLDPGIREARDRCVVTAGEILAVGSHHRRAHQPVEDPDWRGRQLAQNQIGQQRANFPGLDRAAGRRSDVAAFGFPIAVQLADARRCDFVEGGGEEMWRPCQRVHIELGNLKSSVKPCLTVSAFHGDGDETVFPGMKV